MNTNDKRPPPWERVGASVGMLERMQTLRAGDDFPTDLLSIGDQCKAETKWGSEVEICSLSAGHEGRHIAADTKDRHEVPGAEPSSGSVDFGELENGDLGELVVVKTWE